MGGLSARTDTGRFLPTRAGWVDTSGPSSSWSRCERRSLTLGQLPDSSEVASRSDGHRQMSPGEMVVSQPANPIVVASCLACQRYPATARAAARFALPSRVRTSAGLRRRSRQMCSSAVRRCLRLTKGARASARCYEWLVRYSSPSSLISGRFGRATARCSASQVALAGDRSRALTCSDTTRMAE